MQLAYINCTKVHHIVPELHPENRLGGILKNHQLCPEFLASMVDSGYYSDQPRYLEARDYQPHTFVTMGIKGVVKMLTCYYGTL